MGDASLPDAGGRETLKMQEIMKKIKKQTEAVTKDSLSLVRCEYFQRKYMYVAPAEDLCRSLSFFREK